MDPITYEALRRNPELLDTLRRQAHRERAEAVHRLIIVPIRRLFSSNPLGALRIRGCSGTVSSRVSAS
jgi:hypothetical protein